MLLFYTGLRVSELRRLDVADIDLSRRVLVGALRKGGGVTDLFLHPDAVAALATWLRVRPDGDSGALFTGRTGTRLGVRRIQKIHKALHTEARLTVRFHPHRLRHAFATALQGERVSAGTIQRLMNHASLTTTSRYLHADEATMRAATASLPSLLRELPPWE